MMDGKNSEMVYARLSEERKTGELLQLPYNFYSEAAAAAASLPPEEKDNNDKLLNTLKAKRIQKLLIYLAYDRQPPQGLPREEMELYKKVKTLLDGSAGADKNSKVRVLADVPELATPSGSVIGGPYKANEIIELDDENQVEFILKNKIGEKV
ncbi:MAG: hypothetical protein M1321_02485 [Candidatus Marsarchaeota archaeon]|nr:hypothetical protein [Candidatus Marsarchaeota archaeon]